MRKETVSDPKYELLHKINDREMSIEKEWHVFSEMLL